MKKTLSICMLMLFAGIASAQKTKFGIKAGYTSATLSATSGNVTENTDAISGFNGGVFADIDFKAITFQPGIIYVGKGGITNDQASLTSTTTSKIKSKLNFNYLEIPLNVIYNIKTKPGKVFFGAGPYVGYALSAKQTIDIDTYNLSGGAFVRHDADSEDLTFGSGTDDVKRFDFGLNALAGFRLNQGLEINLGLGLGLSNLSNDSNVKINNHTLSVGLGYFFK